MRLIGNTVVAYPHAQAQIASSPDPTQKSGRGLVRGVVQVYGICIRALHLPVIAVMIIGVMRLPHNEDGVRSRIRHHLFQAVFERTTYPSRYVYFRWSRVHTAVETAGAAAVVM